MREYVGDLSKRRLVVDDRKLLLVVSVQVHERSEVFGKAPELRLKDLVGVVCQGPARVVVDIAKYWVKLITKVSRAHMQETLEVMSC